MIIVRDNIWLCVDCMIYAVNGDASGLDYHYGKDADKRLAEIQAGLDKLGPHLVPDRESDEDTGEITEGHREFSNCGCDCCGSRLAGEFHRFAILGES